MDDEILQHLENQIFKYLIKRAKEDNLFDLSE